MQEYTLQPIKPIDPSNTLPANFDSELNPAQLEAVYHDDGPMLVIAGAGSGKTKTLVYRVARLVASGVSPDAILLLTFTRKSSQEMLRRATHILDSRCQKVGGGTFHAFSNIVMHRYGHHIGYDERFTILDRTDAEDLVSMIRREAGLNKVDKRFPKKNTILSVISKAINTNRDMGEVLMQDFPQFAEFKDDLIQIAAQYRDQKKAMQVMDYDDLLVNLCILLRNVPEVREQLQSHYRYIMVDEYQDTNKIQAEILRYLAGDTGNIMAVGDDAQSIYSFRGANFKNIMRFPEIFEGCKIVKLEQNYRSTQPILDLTNAIIDRAKERYAKRLFSDRVEGLKPTYIEADSEYAQSRFVTQKVLELRESGIELSEIAILIRSGWHSNDLEVQLQASNIPFQKFGGFKFIETSHVKDVLAYLRIMANPLDSVSWNRVLMLLPGVGPKAASDIIKSVLSDREVHPSVALGKFIKKLYFKDVMELCDLVFPQTPKKPAALIADVMVYYRPFFKDKYDDHHKREQDIESVETVAARFDALDQFLDEMTLEPPTDSQSGAAPESLDDEKLTISTIHSAKGLEWKAVFLISAVDGYLPSFQSLGDLGQIEEERRLMYVALTRAKDQLFVIKPNLDMSSNNHYRHTGMQFSQVSRFLEEGALLDKFAQKLALVSEKPKKAFFSFYDSDEDDDPVRAKYRF